MVREHRADADARIVDQDIHAAVLGHHFVGQDLHSGSIPDIRHVTAHTPPLLLELVGDLCESRLVDVHKGEMSPLRAQAACQCPSDATSGAGDDHDLVS